jgi:hypothetical protein
VLTRAGGIWARNIVPLCLVALVAALPYYTQGFLAGLTGVKQTRPGLAVVFLFTTLVARPLCYAIFVVAVFQVLSGQRMRIGTAMKQAFARVLPLIACSVFAALAVTGGMMLLVIPGLIVLTMLSVSAQACIIEKLGPIASLSRSAALTKGNRWRLFGLILLVSLLVICASWIWMPLQKLFGRPAVFIGFLFYPLASAYKDTVYAVQFHDLRISKEGVGTERIASVFD